MSGEQPAEYGFDARRSRRCECGAESCTAIIELSWAEQDEVDHGAPELWILAPGHEPHGAKSWRIVRETDRFRVVEVQEAPA
jgi:hypothetical protein